METINHEYYVSLELAKLLKEAGFDWGCRGYFDGIEFHPNGSVECTNYNSNTCKYLKAPTIEIAQRWLREVKNIFIEVTRYETINPLARELFEAVYDKIVDKSFAYIVNVLDANNESIYDEDCFLTYEEAQEAGIKKTLELILEEGK